MKSTAKVTKVSKIGGGKVAGGGQKDVRSDKKSGTGMSGSPKKGGRGGKFTWSGDGYSEAELGGFQKGAIDVKDPNFEDPDEE